EETLVELRPLRHAAAMHVVREVVDERQACARWRRRIAAPEILEAGQGAEIDVVDRVAVGILGIAVDEIDQRVADSLDRRNVEFARACIVLDAPGAALDELGISAGGIAHSKRHGAYARAVAPREVLGERARLGVEDEVDVALLVERHVLVAMLRDAMEAEPL